MLDFAALSKNFVVGQMEILIDKICPLELELEWTPDVESGRLFGEGSTFYRI